jgi:hypothetical protein
MLGTALNRICQTPALARAACPLTIENTMYASQMFHMILVETPSAYISGSNSTVCSKCNLKLQSLGNTSPKRTDQKRSRDGSKPQKEGAETPQTRVRRRKAPPPLRYAVTAASV